MPMEIDKYGTEWIWKIPKILIDENKNIEEKYLRITNSSLCFISYFVIDQL